MSNAHPPLVSVIMPVYNSASTIAEAVQSVMDQTCADWELIIVDDGSTDRSLETLSEHVNDRRLRIHSQTNRGVSAARNTGLRMAQGKYIAFLDADDLWMENKLAEQTRFLLDNQRSNLGLAHSAYIEFNKRREYRPKALKHAKNIKMEGSVSESLAIHNFIGLLTVIIPATTLEDVGGFDENIFAASDWDLWLRIAKKYPIGYINEPLAKYRFNPAGISKNYTKYEKELWKVVKRHLLDGDYPESSKRRGLWLFYRHMAHGFARSRRFGESVKHFVKTCQTKPLAFANIATLSYICLLFLGCLFKKRS